MKILKPLFLFGALIPFAGNTQYGPSPDRAIHYELERNEPSNSGLFGVIIDPVYVDGSKLNLNIGGGLEFYYTMNSHLRINGGYRFAYLDNLTGDDHNDDLVGSLDSWGAPVKRKKSSNFNVLASATILSWEKEDNYHITLGSAGPRTIAVTHVRGNVLRALTARVGYQIDNRVIQSKNTGNLYKTTTPDYVYYYEGNGYPLTATNLGNSATMMQSDIATIGIGYTTFRDIKISLDDTKYKGRREERSQMDLFFDLMYAHKLELQDVIYYHTLNTVTNEYSHIPQRIDLSATPLNKLGFRVGYQVLSMYHPHFGTKILLEGGMRPGPKTDQKNTNLYAQFTVGLIFGGRIAPSEE